MFDLGGRVELTGERSRPATEDDPEELVVQRRRRTGIPGLAPEYWVLGEHSSTACLSGHVTGFESPIWPGVDDRVVVLLDDGQEISTDAHRLREAEPNDAATATAKHHVALRRGISGGAVNPTFESTPRTAVASVSTANTARDGSGTLASIITGVSAGTRIDRLVLNSTADPADSTVTIFLFDGSTAWYWREVDLGNPAAGSTTVAPFFYEIKLADAILPNGSWILKAAITVALTSGVMNLFAHGGDLT
jgi:hypothetical protein